MGSVSKLLEKARLDEKPLTEKEFAHARIWSNGTGEVGEAIDETEAPEAAAAEVPDAVVRVGGAVHEVRGPRVTTRASHGTGCTLASAVAAGLAQGMSLRDAVARARLYVRAAIAAAPGYGQGHGPLDHGVTVDPERLRRSGVAVTRVAQGVLMGGALDVLDDGTLAAALRARRPF